MRTEPAYAGPARGSRRCGAADGFHDEVRAALEEQVEQARRAQQTRRPPEQSHEASLVEAHGASGLHRLPHAGRDLAARPELPGRIEPFALILDGEEFAAIAQLLDRKSTRLNS